jgi:hypothetical protein
MLIKVNTTFMIVFVSTITFVLMGLTIGVISFPMQTAVAFLDAPIPPTTTSSNSTLSNATTSNISNSTG